jgi:excisionase family DNA binding protein
MPEPSKTPRDSSDRDLWLTPSQVADELGFQPNTVRNWIRQGELSAVRIGPRKLRVHRSELRRFLQSHDELADATVVGAEAQGDRPPTPGQRLIDDAPAEIGA